MSTDILGGNAIGEEALAQMRATGGEWAAYQNIDLGHPQLGDIRFLKYGEGCTFAVAPKKYPDSHLGLGWRYRYVGTVNLTAGIIEGGAS